MTKSTSKIHKLDSEENTISVLNAISPEALAMGDIHNRLYLWLRKAHENAKTPPERAIASLELAFKEKAVNKREYKYLYDMITNFDVKKNDFGLTKAKEIREHMIFQGCGNLAIAAASVAVSTVELNLSEANPNEPQQVRRRRLWIALADVGGALVGGLLGGLGGAGLGAGLASEVTNAALD